MSMEDARSLPVQVGCLAIPLVVAAFLILVKLLIPLHKRGFSYDVYT